MKENTQEILDKINKVSTLSKFDIIDKLKSFLNPSLFDKIVELPNVEPKIQNEYFKIFDKALEMESQCNLWLKRLYLSQCRLKDNCLLYNEIFHDIKLIYKTCQEYLQNNPSISIPNGIYENLRDLQQELGFAVDDIVGERDNIKSLLPKVQVSCSIMIEYMNAGKNKIVFSDEELNFYQGLYDIVSKFDIDEDDFVKNIENNRLNILR